MFRPISAAVAIKVLVMLMQDLNYDMISLLVTLGSASFDQLQLRDLDVTNAQTINEYF